MTNPAHAAAVAEIESMTRDYCATASKLPIVDERARQTSDGTPVDRAAGMNRLSSARQYVANCYQITSPHIVLGLRHISEQTQWAQMTHDQRVAHLTLYFNLRPV